ncbi:hypothetical protein LS684_14425 [Cytobacillus spongiae]|jgi:hypothetical protein|uniref:hypothetical protein n=1 Tax=Cytobacillus spongiae TaxID=2901381 RepID=UPI001F3FB41C|nr:hypothetical protein [Cytobacillus spongiae]UII54846.1 hypothetical protein LS684_14425 [Cytobacillus spongiae]
MTPSKEAARKFYEIAAKVALRIAKEGVESGFRGFTTVRMQTQLYQGLQGLYQ